MKLIRLLHFLSSILNSFSPMKEQNDDHADDTGADQSQPSQSDTSAGGDEQFHLPMTRFIWWIGYHVHLRIGNNL